MRLRRTSTANWIHHLVQKWLNFGVDKSIIDSTWRWRFVGAVSDKIFLVQHGVKLVAQSHFLLVHTDETHKLEYNYYQLKIALSHSDFTEPLNGVIFSQSTLNSTNMTQTASLNTAKLFLAIFHIIIVLSEKQIWIRYWCEIIALESARSSFFKKALFYTVRRPFQHMNLKRARIYFMVTKNLVTAELGCRAVKLVWHLVVVILRRKQRSSRCKNLDNPRRKRGNFIEFLSLKIIRVCTLFY